MHSEEPSTQCWRSMFTNVCPHYPWTQAIFTSWPGKTTNISAKNQRCKIWRCVVAPFGDVFKSWPVDWLKVLRPTDTKTGHFGVVTITSNTGAQLEHSLCTTASKLLKVHCLIAAKVRRNRDHVGASEPPLIVDHRCHGFCPTHRNTHPSVYSTWTTKVVDNKRMV